MSRATRIVSSLALLAFFAAAIPAPAATDPSLDAIVARYVAARGGLDRIRAIATLRQKGHASAGASREALVTRELKRPDHARFEFTVQGVTAVFVSNGQRGWRVSPFEGDQNPEPLADEVVKEAAEQGDIEGPLVDWKAKGHTLELVGRESIGGREAYKLKLTLKSGAIRYEYLDVKSLNLVRSDSTRQVRGRPVEIQTTFSDFKKAGGVVFPHLLEIAAKGRPQRLRVVVEKVEVNPSLSDARFEMPSISK